MRKLPKILRSDSVKIIQYYSLLFICVLGQQRADLVPWLLAGVHRGLALHQLDRDADEQAASAGRPRGALARDPDPA